MKRSTKITSIIVIFFLVIASVIIARTMIGNHFKKKFSKRPPPGIIVKTVEQRKFQNIIETFGTAVPIKTQSYNIEKYEILENIKYNTSVKSGDVVAKLKNRTITAPFDGVIGKRNFSDDINVSESSVVIDIEDASFLFIDVDVPEIFAPFVKKGLGVDIKFSGNKDKIYKGKVDSLASKIDVSNRSLRLRVKMQNTNSEILPGALMEVTIKYNERISLGIPDTSVILEGNKVYIYKVDKENVTNRVEVKVGNRNEGYLEVESGLKEGDIVVAEGLKKVRPNGKIKPIKDGEKKNESSWGKKENKSK
jgi:membrane fusion protein (multidrug efflux system)